MPFNWLHPKTSWLSLGLLVAAFSGAAASVRPFLERHCFDCHDSDSRKGGLDLSTLSTNAAEREAFARWVKIYDRVAAGEMPPAKKPRPPAAELKSFTNTLASVLVA